MQHYGLIVIGSGPAGIAAATAYQDAGGTGAVLVLSSDADPPYMRPPLSKDSLASADEPELTPLSQDLGTVELQLATVVTTLDVSSRTVSTASAEFGFERLVLATGATPVSLPGMREGVEHHELRTLSDLRGLHSSVSHARSVVVVGSGFIGCEAAVSLARRGLDVTVVTPEMAPQQDRLGAHVAEVISGWLREYGVDLLTGVEVESVEPACQVHLSDGSVQEPDLLLVAVGVEPVIDLAADSGLSVERGRVLVDQHLETGHPGIYAVGDIALADHPVAGRPIGAEHWGDAEAMGDIAGRNAAGARETWSAAPGFWSVIGDHTLKYAAWGDGHDDTTVVEHPDGGFTVWYTDDRNTVVGVLTHEADEDYERGRELLERTATLTEALKGAS